MTYAVLSDIHAHAWTIFSHTGADGVNSRLRITLDEILRAAHALQAAGGSTMVIAGDILHTRGQIDPEVLNPLRDTFETILAMGISIYAIPGNHDLKSADTQELSSAIQNLAQTHFSGGEFRVFNSPVIDMSGSGAFGRAYVPWCNSKDQLLIALDDLTQRAGSLASKIDVFIHAGIDGVLSGMPAHGLTHTDLGKFGFRRVFAGHYHNHKDFGNGVVSIGATCHQNWGDVGTKAGFLLVDEATGAFTFEASHAPSFIDISGLDETEIMLAAPGNYVRVRGASMTDDEVRDLRRELTKMGAVGTSIEVPRQTQTVRSTSTGGQVKTLEQSIGDFVAASAANLPANVMAADVTKGAIEILNLSRAVAD